ncbi:MAG: RNA 2',3'-cyclic phosphodiesterase [Bacteroidota bacterium]
MTVSPQRRLFLGIPLPSEILYPLHDFRYAHDDLSGVKWVQEDLLHITMYFFGEIPGEIVDNLLNLIYLGVKGRSSFSLTFDKYSFAPPGQEARMIWARYQKHPMFREMAIRLHELFLQIRPEQQFRKSPIPHITLARLRNFQQTEMLTFPPQGLPRLEVDQLILWESQLSPQGPEYEEIHRFRLMESE